MGTIGKDRVESLWFSDDPGALVRAVFLAHLTNRVVPWKTSLESRRRNEEHPGKGRADKGEQTHQRNQPETAPAEPAKKITPRPQAASLRAFTESFLTLSPLLNTTTLFVCLDLFRSSWFFCHGAYSLVIMIIPFALLSSEHESEPAPYPHDHRQQQHHQPYRGKERQENDTNKEKWNAQSNWAKRRRRLSRIFSHRLFRLCCFRFTLQQAYCIVTQFFTSVRPSFVN